MFISNETIRVIRLVAKYQSISTAADELNRVPSAVSYTVRKFEEVLGAQLFNRHGRQLTLTPAGEYFIQHSKTILDDLEALKRNTVLVADGIERELRVAVNNIIPAEAIVQFAQAFETHFPFVQLTIAVEVYNGCWDALYDRRADLVVGAPHAVPSVEGILSETLGNLAWDFVVGNQHALASQTTPLNNAELRQYPAVCIKDTAIHFTPQQAWLLEGQKPIFVSDYPTAMALIQRNVGIGYLPHHLCYPLLNSGQLMKKPMVEHKHPTLLFLAHRAEGLGKVRQWCVDYLCQPEVKGLWCGSDTDFTPAPAATF